MIHPGDSAPVLKAGATNTFTLQGGAVHGGGSCQISITYDKQPTKGSKFTVIKSFHGNCPIENGNENLSATSGTPHNPKSFLLPEDVPEGEGLLVWTWFNKMGNREMYMRCAPVVIKNDKGGDKAKFDKRPDIFKANIGNGCGTKEGTNVIFPNPGDQVEGTGNGEPVGEGCDKPLGGGSPAPAPSQPQTPRIPKEGNIGGGNDEVDVKPTPSPTPAPKPAPAPIPGNDVAPPLVDTPKKEIKVPTPTPGPVTPSPLPEGGACESGKIYCNGESKFSICNFGKLVDMGSVAAGTKCVNNVIQRRNMVRFSAAHMRRRHFHKL